MKPLSPQTLEKKYLMLGLPREKTDLLHDYFLCFCHLYGVISLRQAWAVFRHYEGPRFMLKKDFMAFSGIVQREPGLPYSVLDIKEVYPDEPSNNPEDRLIANNRLLSHGYYKFAQLCDTAENQLGKPCYLPADKASLMAYVQDQLYLSPDGQEMVRFLSGLKTDGIRRGLDGEICGEILDVDGNPVKGKCLPDFVFYTADERFDIDYTKNGSRKEALLKEYRTTALDKMLDFMRTDIQIGGPDILSPAKVMDFLIKFLAWDCGVPLTRAQTERFCLLYQNLNNHSHLWHNFGWRPDELMRAQASGRPESMEIGPGLKQLFDEGALDRDAFERRLGEMGIRLTEK